MSKDYHVANEPQKATFSLGMSAGMGTYGATGNLNVGAKKNNTYINFSAGMGQANIISGKAGHEFRWGDFGLDLSAGVMARKNNKPSEIYMRGEVVIPGHEEGISQFEMDENGQISEHQIINSIPDTNSKLETTINYKEVDTRVHVGAEGTYRPSSRVKIGLGGEIGVKKFNAPNAEISVVIEQAPLGAGEEPVTTSIEAIYHNENSPKIYGTPTASIEIGLDKNNKVQLTGNGSLYEGRLGVQYNF